MDSKGDLNVIESRKTKIIVVKHWKGALSYWGLATHPSLNWDTVSWLERFAASAHASASAEEFARQLRSELESAWRSYGLSCGIGIHFTAYERQQDIEIPELFLITNWNSPSYSAVGRFGVSRETFHIVSGRDPDASHREFENRIAVHQLLSQGHMLSFNNGHPTLFNHAAGGLFAMFQELSKQSSLRNSNELKTWARLGRWPVEAVIQAQRDFVVEGRRRVGGMAHAVAISKTGEYLAYDGHNKFWRP